MEALKRQRKSLRTSFTKAHNAFLSTFESGSREEKLVAFQLLENKMAELDTAQVAFNKVLFESKTTDEEITKEMESGDSYKTHYLAAKLKMCEFSEKEGDRTSSTVNSNASGDNAIETLKKQRRNLRASFTKVHVALTAKLESGSREEKFIALQFLGTKMVVLDAVHEAFNKVLFESQMPDEEIAKKVETDEGYKTSYLIAKLKMSDLLETTSVPT